MNYIALKIFPLLFIVHLVLGRCPYDHNWEFYDGYCYFMFYHSKFFADAEAHCVQLGGHLVSFHSDSERFYIYRKLIRNPYAKNRDDAYWVGLTNRPDGKWRWTDGTPTDDFNNWLQGRPDEKGNANCAYVTHDSEGKYDDSPCESGTVPKDYICKRKQLEE